ncbi:hypothetical protein KAM385_47000 [Aeromonas hydrophila]|uniref:hypothetical protein n=1 Tax=Aeromonas hydrophila TaxID=644 RepID=UPI001CC50061|nr:hypothetical protein [Aeromonas hydrophila]GJC07671.1 hypothetical protein KAM385_47000 [Aeromonas hydrophila]
MDPVSYLFSAYLNLVQQQVSDIYGTELKSLVVEYEGEQIPFAFQFWQLQPKSVCRSYEQVSIHRNSIDTGKMRRSSLDPTFLLA